MKHQHSPAFLQKRKLLMVLPILTLPFLTLLFWSLGGGKVASAGTEAKAQSGFNLSLPEAILNEDKTLTKMSYYEKAAADSQKLKELIKNDPYYKQSNSIENNVMDIVIPDIANKGLLASPYPQSQQTDAGEANIYEKLEQLNTVLRKTPSVNERTNINIRSKQNTIPVERKEVDRLEQLMLNMNSPEGEDKELQQLNGMLDKILDIQHPERIQEKNKQTFIEEKGKLFAVTSGNEEMPVSLLTGGGQNQEYTTFSNLAPVQKGFYGLEELETIPEQNAITAEVQETQTLVNGSIIKLRLTTDVYINGTLIPKDQFVFGAVSLSNERLMITINNIRYQNAIFPVALKVYDLDGILGLYVPGAISRDVAKQSADRSVQAIGLSDWDNSLSGQVASAGVEAAKNLVSKRMKLTKVTVKAGYKVLLIDEKQNQIH